MACLYIELYLQLSHRSLHINERLKHVLLDIDLFIIIECMFLTVSRSEHVPTPTLYEQRHVYQQRAQ